MSISTKTGDRGQTSLYSGERVSKDDLRVEAYGTLDELDAHIGVAKHLLDDAALRDFLIEVQNTLFRAMGTLASKEQPYPYPLCAQDAEVLTTKVHELEAVVELTGFVVPGSTPASAQMDICRTVARRAERRIIALAAVENVPEAVLQYVNRLSDLLYIIARYLEKRDGKLIYKTKPLNPECGT